MKAIKKLIVLVLTMAMCFSVLALTASADDDEYYGDIAYGAATTNASLLNIRGGCGTDYEILGTIPYGSVIVILDCTEEGWYHINYNGIEGYCCTDYLENILTAEDFSATGMLTGDEVRLRALPNTDCEILGYYYSGTRVSVIGINNGWYKLTDGGLTGYIRSDLMTIVGGPDGSVPVYEDDDDDEYVSYEDDDDDDDDDYTVSSSEPAQEEEPVVYTSSSEGSELGQEIANYALQFVGYDYVYGGASPSEGFDCSGFVMYVYQQFGVYMPHGATSQYICDLGYVVSKADLQPGDLVFFNGDGDGISHVGMYIGNGQIVHASGSTVGVIISDLSSSYYTAVYYSAKRFI